MDRTHGWEIVAAQRTAVADALATLSAAEWESPSLCRGWTVRDVGAHLSIAPTIRLGETLAAVVAARGSFDRMIHDTAVARSADRSTDEIVEDLREVATSRRLAPTTVWRDPLLDIVVHAHDAFRPLGRPVPAPLEATREAADWAWRRGFPFRPSRRLRGVRLVATDTDWARGPGSGQEVRGAVAALLLLSTGRAVRDDEVEGPGVDLLRPLGQVVR